MDGTCLAASTVVDLGSFHMVGDEGEVDVGEDLAEVGWSAEFDSLKENVSGGV